MSVYGAHHTAEVIARVLDSARTLTSGPIGANFLLAGVDPGVAREWIAAAASRARVIDCFWAEPERALVDLTHAAGALICWQVGSRDEAVAAAEAGCDFVIAQGLAQYLASAARCG